MILRNAQCNDEDSQLVLNRSIIQFSWNQNISKTVTNVYV